MPLEERIPCPTCGSKSRMFEVNIEGSLRFYRNLGIKARHGLTGRPFYETKIGDDRHHKSGKWMRIVRIIDRVKDYYFEEVVDPETGEIVHRCEEPLSKHKGHGSARRK